MCAPKLRALLCWVLGWLLVGTVWQPALAAERHRVLKLPHGSTCAYFGEALPERVSVGASSSDTERVIDTIIHATGLAPNFVLRSGEVGSAAAVIRDERRYIIYSRRFIGAMTHETGDRWPAISVLAHEIGHHLNGHTLVSSPDARPKQELEADYYSGFVLQRMGATLDEARKAMELYGSPVASASHPARPQRLAAITRGWLASCKTDPRCRIRTERGALSLSPPKPAYRASQPAGHSWRHCTAEIEACGHEREAPLPLSPPVARANWGSRWR